MVEQQAELVGRIATPAENTSTACLDDAGTHKSNAGYHKAEQGKVNTADKHLPGCDIAYDAASYPKLDSDSLKKGGYEKATPDGSGNTVVTKGNESWTYDGDGKPFRHDRIVGKKDYEDLPDGTKREWEGNTVKTTNPDGSYKEENGVTKVGFTRDTNGHEHHWGPKTADNYDIVKDATGVLKINADGSKEWTYNNGDQKFASANGKSGHTVIHHEGGRFSPMLPTREEHHWGPKPEDNYDLTQYAMGSQKKFADGHTESQYEGGQKVVTRGNEVVSTGKQPEDNYRRTVDPTTHKITLKFADGRTFETESNGKTYLVHDGKRTEVGAPSVRTD